MKKLVAALCIVSNLACASLRPGEDATLVRGEQGYAAARDTLNLVFTIEDKTQTYLESKIPGSHAAVEALRIQARQKLPSLLVVIDAYKQGGDSGRLIQTLATVEAIVAEAQKMLNPPVTLRRGLGVGEILAILSAGRELASWIQAQRQTGARTGSWTSEERLAIDSTWSAMSTSHAWLTDTEGGE
jgi:hypothetical protein